MTVTFAQNPRSRSSGNIGHVGPEYAAALNWLINEHFRAKDPAVQASHSNAMDALERETSAARIIQNRDAYQR